MAVKVFPIAEGVQFAALDWKMPATLDEVNRRLPDGIRWQPKTRELLSVGEPVRNRRPMTGADIDWSALDQELGEETSLPVAVAVLIEEVGLDLTPDGRGVA